MASELFDLTGRLALITGSSRGLGLALARGLGQAGATVVLNGRDPGALDAATKALNDDGLDACGITFDITDAHVVADAVAEIERDHAPIDILVNNAGIQRRAPLEDFPEDDWRAVIDTNLTAVHTVSRAVVGGMIARKRGKIINICSLMSEVARPTTGAYAAAKGGLKMLTRAMATEWAAHNIQVNAIGPGYFDTEMTRPLVEDDEFNSWICRRTPAGRWGKPQELVGTSVFLASAASSFVNGQIIYVDGGVLATL